MPVARNVWQQVEEGSPASFARRFTIRSTSARAIGFPLTRYTENDQARELATAILYGVPTTRTERLKTSYVLCINGERGKCLGLIMKGRWCGDAITYLAHFRRWAKMPV
jgi:hypothetical protein